MLLEMGTPIATATLRLDNDQILNNRDPIVLVPPDDVTNYLRAPRTLPVPESFKFIFDDTNGEYSNTVTLKLSMGDSDVKFLNNFTLNPQGMMIFSLSPQSDMNTFPYNQDISTLLRDNGLYIQLSGAVTGGDPANFLYVSLQFSVMDL